MAAKRSSKNVSVPFEDSSSLFSAGVGGEFSRSLKKSSVFCDFLKSSLSDVKSELSNGCSESESKSDVLISLKLNSSRFVFSDVALSGEGAAFSNSDIEGTSI